MTRLVALTSFLIVFARVPSVMAQQACPAGTIAIWVQQDKTIQIGCSKDILSNLDQTVQGLSQQVQNLAQQVQALQAAKRNPPPPRAITAASAAVGQTDILRSGLAGRTELRN